MLRRGFSLFIASVLLLILAVPMIIIAVLIYYKLGKPILFRQPRVGLNGKTFTLYKFRTMSLNCNDYGETLPDALRLTALGQRLRSASLDELPQLFNVCKGDMNLVGPRPLLVEYLPLYTQEQLKRHLVKPGITGWAQINGRNALSWE